MVLDRVSIHKAPTVGEWLDTREDAKIELHFLPTHSPGLNPAEMVWSLGKRIVGKEFVKSKKGLKIRPWQRLRRCETLQRRSSVLSRSGLHLHSCLARVKKTFGTLIASLSDEAQHLAATFLPHTTANSAGLDRNDSVIIRWARSSLVGPELIHRYLDCLEFRVTPR